MLIDVLGAFFDLLSTWYFIRLNRKAWSAGLIATILNSYLYWQQGIYADMILSCFYCINFSYGWYYWHKPEHQLQIQRLFKPSPIQWLNLSLLCAALILATYFLLQRWAPSNVAFLDSVTTSLSIIAQWLMYHKILFSWILWFITDLFYILLYLFKEMPCYAVLMIVYSALAVMGYYQWRRYDQNRLPFHQEKP